MIAMNGRSEVNPYVGPRSIQQGEPLYGRREEVHALFCELQARRIVVLHSPSGAGKSSLVQAGLIPRLQEEKFDVWKPIRVNLDPTGLEGVPKGTNRYLLSAMLSLEQELPEGKRRSAAQLAGLDFGAYLRARPRREKQQGQPVVLLFDQFEEVLTVAPRAVEAKRAFFTAVGRALADELYWALFIVREDFLAAFSPYRDRIPTCMANTLRLDLLGLEGAREAALQPALEAGREFPAVDLLIRDLSTTQVQQADGSFVAEQGLHIEPVQLQVVCRRLWAAMPAGDRSIDAEDIARYASVSDSLAGYYAKAVADVAGGDVGVERVVREWVGDGLIVGGIRSQVRQAPGKSGGLDNVLIEGLLDSYLVRTEQRAGANWFELSHDRLVEPVQQDNEEWEQAHLHLLQVQAKLWENARRERALLLGADALPAAVTWAKDNATQVTASEWEFLEQSQARRAKEKAARRKLVALATTAVMVAVVVAVLGVVAFLARNRARDAELDAKSGKERAVKAQRSAETAKDEAETAKGEAEKAQRSAEKAQRSAEKAKGEAEKARQTNKRLVRDLLQQMFQVALRRFIQNIGEDGSTSGEIIVDKHWTPLLEHGKQRFAAATLIEGGGRIIAAGNEAVLRKVDKKGHSLFLEISVKWLLADQASRRVGILGRESQPGNKKIRKNLENLNYECKFVSLLELANEKDVDVGMLIIGNHLPEAFAPAGIAAVESFLHGGGGLLVADRGPASTCSASEEPCSPPEDYFMNRLLRPFGIAWTGMEISSSDLEVDRGKATLILGNFAGHEVDVYVDAFGEEIYYTTLGDKAILDMQATIGGEWSFCATGDDHRIGTVEVKEGEHLVEIHANQVKQVEPTGPSVDSVVEKYSRLGYQLADSDIRGYYESLKAGDLKSYLKEAICVVKAQSRGALLECHPPTPEPQPGAQSVGKIVTKYSILGCPLTDADREYYEKLKASNPKSYQKEAAAVMKARSREALRRCHR